MPVFYAIICTCYVDQSDVRCTSNGADDESHDDAREHGDGRVPEVGHCVQPVNAPEIMIIHWYTSRLFH